MKNIILAGLLTMMTFSSIYAEEMFDELGGQQFRLECSDEYGRRHTFANEPQKTKYFLFGPNVRIRDKGVMDLGAYNKGPIKFFRNDSIYGQRIEILFSSDDGGSNFDETWLRKATLKKDNTLEMQLTVLDAGKNLDFVSTSKYQNCMSMGLPW